MMRRIVMAIDEEGSTVAIGPVARDESVEEIRELIEARGWENYGVVTYQPFGDFKRECKRPGGVK